MRSDFNFNFFNVVGNPFTQIGPNFVSFRLFNERLEVAFISLVKLAHKITIRLSILG